MQPMNLDDVAVFLRVVELGSLSAAARERDAPVSQVSRALARLESLAQARLLHRTTHSLALTEAGTALVEHGRAMLSSLDALHGELDTTAQRIRGTVHIGASPAMANFFIVPELPLLAQRHPELQVAMHVDDRYVDMAKQGLDVAIRTGALSSDNLVARRIGSHGRRLFAAPSYLARHGTPQSLADLAAHRLIVNSSIPAFNRWLFRVNGEPVVYQPKGFYRTSSSGVMLQMAIHGMGIVRANTAICDAMLRAGQLVRVLDALVEDELVPVNAVILAERHRAPKVRAVVEFFSERFAAAGMAASARLVNLP
jgi:DNA-binding transcriptional LysR family regulator